MIQTGSVIRGEQYRITLLISDNRLETYLVPWFISEEDIARKLRHSTIFLSKLCGKECRNYYYHRKKEESFQIARLPRTAKEAFDIRSKYHD